MFERGVYVSNLPKRSWNVACLYGNQYTSLTSPFPWTQLPKNLKECFVDLSSQSRIQRGTHCSCGAVSRLDSLLFGEKSMWYPVATGILLFFPINFQSIFRLNRLLHTHKRVANDRLKYGRGISEIKIGLILTASYWMSSLATSSG